MVFQNSIIFSTANRRAGLDGLWAQGARMVKLAASWKLMEDLLKEGFEK